MQPAAGLWHRLPAVGTSPPTLFFWCLHDRAAGRQLGHTGFRRQGGWQHLLGGMPCSPDADQLDQHI